MNPQEHFVSPLIEQVKDGVCDSDFLIYYYASALPVPQWSDESAKDCTHCSQPLKSGKKHICRLCGVNYCNQCTTKLHLPEKYDLKGKTGPTRVCYGCRMACLRMRQAAEGHPLQDILEPMTVPVWQEQDSFAGCLKCAKKTRSPHNCRCCGILYCDDCSSKLNIIFPPAFNKKNKTGPQRVCDGCRYRIVAGATMSDRPTQLIKLNAKYTTNDEESLLIDSHNTNPSSTSKNTRVSLSTSSNSSGNSNHYHHQPKNPFETSQVDAFAVAQSKVSHQHDDKKDCGDEGVSAYYRHYNNYVNQQDSDTNTNTAGPTVTDAVSDDGAAQGLTGTRIVGTMKMGPKVMLDVQHVNLNKTNTNNTLPLPTSGVPMVATMSEVHLEQHVLPSQLRRTVIDDYVPLPKQYANNITNATINTANAGHLNGNTLIASATRKSNGSGSNNIAIVDKTNQPVNTTFQSIQTQTQQGRLSGNQTQQGRLSGNSGFQTINNPNSQLLKQPKKPSALLNGDRYPCQSPLHPSLLQSMTMKQQQQQQQYSNCDDDEDDLVADLASACYGQEDDDVDIGITTSNNITMGTGMVQGLNGQPLTPHPHVFANQQMKYNYPSPTQHNQYQHYHYQPQPKPQHINNITTQRVRANTNTNTNTSGKDVDGLVKGVQHMQLQENDENMSSQHQHQQQFMY